MRISFALAAAAASSVSAVVVERPTLALGWKESLTNLVRFVSFFYLQGNRTASPLEPPLATTHASGSTLH